MRIAYFTESSLPLVDGVSLTLARLFQTLVARGIEFRVFTAFPPDPSTSWADRVRQVRSVTFPLYRAYRVSVPGGRAVARELDAFAPELIHVASPTPMGRWAKRRAGRLGIPAVATFHTDFVSYFRYYRVRPLEALGWRLLRSFYDGFAAVYAPTATAASELRQHGIRNVDIWSRGVDAALFSPERRDPGLRTRLGGSDAVPIVLFVSRLVREKDLDDLVAADALLRARQHRFQLVLVGDGPLRGELEARLPHARFEGSRRGLELARYYASADLFVFPSTTETFGNVVLEAQASGLPAVVVDRGGPQDVVSAGESGFVARANDPASLADAVALLLNDAELRRSMAEAARRRALAMEWEAVNGALLERYRSHLDTAAARRATALGR
jgi:phosphatidylinositol alpha 1,6-mannosyltransferase